MRFEERLKQYAYAMGIDLIGITTAEPFADAWARLRRMETKGYLSPWAESDLQKRTHPKLLMEDAASLIAVGASYDLPEDERQDGGLRGRLARFARFQDYHQVLTICMERLVEWIRQTYPALRAQIFVDTGPLIDREVAYRAGLGFIGKNSALIHPQWGSFLALGEILVNISLRPDQPLENGCGDCTLCLSACPQRAITAPGEIRTTECLAHYTQEKGLLTPEICRRLGTRLWGCDTCQDVCPYNRRRLGRNTGGLFQPHRWGTRPDLREILRLSNRQYREDLGGTAMAWRGKTVLQRNALINLGNLRDRESVSLLAEALSDPRPVIRGTAAWALGEVGGDAARILLCEALEKEQEAEVRREMERALKEQTLTERTDTSAETEHKRE